MDNRSSTLPTRSATELLEMVPSHLIPVLVATWGLVAEHVARSLRSLRTAVVMGPLIASILDRSASAPARS